MKILLSWSSGKDAAWSLHHLRREYPGAVAGLLTTTNEAFDRVAMHAVRRELVEAQAHAAALPLHIVPLPWPCPNEEYERRMNVAVAGFVRDGYTHVAFGDLFLEDVRRYREDRLAGSGLTPLFPLWKTKPTRDLAWDMIEGGLQARLTCVDPRTLDRAFAGRAFDATLMRDLPPAVDPCGENGEFHSFACAGPMFQHPIDVRVGEIVDRDGFVFADLTSAHEPDHQFTRSINRSPVQQHDRQFIRPPDQQMPPSPYPCRIICLTEETTETLYLLGEGDRVVGISGYTVRPPEARQKPKVSAFINARFDKIVALEPDLILAFSDLQADIAAELIRRGYPVYTFNQRSVAGILQMIRTVGGLVGAQDRAEALAARLELGLDEIRLSAAGFPRRPRVYFEEWDNPLISGIRWVDELIEMAGGDTIFPELRSASLAKDRIVTSEQVIARAPEVFIGSWCGKPVRPEKVKARPGWNAIPAIRDNHVYEVKSTYILQPGPASVTEGVRRVHGILRRWADPCSVRL